MNFSQKNSLIKSLIIKLMKIVFIFLIYIIFYLISVMCPTTAQIRANMQYDFDSIKIYYSVHVDGKKYDWTRTFGDDTDEAISCHSSGQVCLTPYFHTRKEFYLGINNKVYMIKNVQRLILLPVIA